MKAENEYSYQSSVISYDLFRRFAVGDRVVVNLSRLRSCVTKHMLTILAVAFLAWLVLGYFGYGRWIAKQLFWMTSG